MKHKKTMLERLKAYHKKCGGYSTVVILSELLWNHAYVTMAVETSSGTECGRVRVPRTMHTYRLKSARGEWTVKPSIDVNGLWYIRKRGTIYPRETGHPVTTFARLYIYSKSKTMGGAVYGRYLNGGATV